MRFRRRVCCARERGASAFGGFRSPPGGAHGRAVTRNRSGYGPARRNCAGFLRGSYAAGEALGLDAATLRTAYYYALLRYIGDELALRRDFAAVDPGQIPEVLELAARYLRQANASKPSDRVAAIVASALSELPGFMYESFAGHCEVAQRLAGRMGLGEPLIVCLGQIYERWDGRGLPRALKGEDLAPAVLLVALAQDAVIWNRVGGPDAAATTIRNRAGGAYHPQMAERFSDRAATILADLDRAPTWEAVLEVEPGGHRPLSLPSQA